MAATFVYDWQGQRFSKAQPSSTPILYSYAQDGSLIAENNSGKITDYVYADGRPIADVEPTATTAADQVNYILADHLGTPQMVSNSSGATVWSTTYQPFGSGGTPVSAILQDLRLPGQNYDLETGFHYNHFRDYMPDLGRYLETDPIGVGGGGMNTYLYVNANPSAFVDRDGNIALPRDTPLPTLPPGSSGPVSVPGLPALPSPPVTPNNGGGGDGGGPSRERCPGS